jgi:hypothetical protein
MEEQEKPQFKLDDKGLLVRLHIGLWGATKADMEVSHDTNRRWAAQDKAGRYRKNLVDNAFTRCKSVRTRATAFHKANSWSFGDEEVRFVPGGKLFEYLSKMKDFEREYEKATMLDIEDWPLHITKAKEGTLGSMFKRDDYPSPYELKKKFYFRLVPYPVPVSSGFGAFLTQLGQEMVDELQTKMEDRTQKAATGAFKEMVTAFYTLVKELNGKLEDPGYTPKEGMLSSLTKFVMNLPKMDFTNSPELAQLRQEVEGKLINLNAETLRHDGIERKKAAEVAQDIMDKMGAFWGN